MARKSQGERPVGTESFTVDAARGNAMGRVTFSSMEMVASYALKPSAGLINLKK